MKPISLCLVLLSGFAYQAHAGSLENTKELTNLFDVNITQNGTLLNYQQGQVADEVLSPSVSEPNKIIEASGNVSTQVLELFSLGDGIGKFGTYLGDFNGDGNNELLLVQPNNVSFVDVVDGEYLLTKQLVLGTNYSGTTDSAYFHDKISDGHFLFVAYSGKLFRLDLLTRKVVALDSVVKANSLVIANFTQADTPDLLVNRNYDNTLFVYNPATLELIGQFSASLGKPLPGSFTEVGAREILMPDGRIFRAGVDSLIEIKQLTEKPLSLKSVAIDTNADGLDELVTAASWYDIKKIDPVLDTVTWTHRADLDINAILVADLNEDGKQDLIYGDGQWGSLHGLNMETGEAFWSIDNPNHGVTNILVGDINKDGSLDIGWGSGYSSSGADNFYVHDIKTKANQWTSKDLGFPTDALALADINNDGNLDAIYGLKNTNSGYGKGMVTAYDINTKEQLWQSETSDNWGKTMVLATADLNRDGKQQLVVASSKIYTGLVQIFDGVSGEAKQEILLGNGDAMTSLLIEDLDGDDKPEIIAGNGAEHTGSEGVFFTVLDGTDGTLKKKSPSLGFSWQGLMNLVAFDDANTEGMDVFGTMGGSLYRYNYQANSIKSYNFANSLQSLAAAIIDGEHQLVAGGTNGILYKLLLNGEQTALANLCSSGSLLGLTAQPGGRILFTCSDSVGEYSVIDKQEVYRLPRTQATKAPAATVFNGKNYTMFGGNMVSVYSDEVATPLTTPDNVKFTTHVKSALDAKLNVGEDVDYVVLEGRPQWGMISFTDRKSGVFSYQPSGVVGEESLQFYAVKGRSVSALAELRIDVTNQAPEAENLSISTHWNKSITFQLPATDADAETLMFSLKSAPAHGTVNLLSGELGEVKFIPSEDSMEVVSFSFSANDSLESSEQKNVTITLTNTNPEVSALSYQTSYLTEVNGALKGQDADEDSITYALVSQPSAGKVTLDESNGLFVYSPSGSADQQVSFTYVAKDKFATSEPQTVTITVKGEVKDSSSGGSLGWSLLAMMGMLATRRSMAHKEK